MHLSLQDIIATIPTRFRPEKAKDYEGIFHFNIVECPFTLIIQEGQCQIKMGIEGKATCLISTNEKTYIAIEMGTLNPQWALMTGKVKVSNVNEMLRFGKMFRKFTKDYIQNEGISPTNQPQRPPQKGPLSGVRILDLSRLLPAPLATQWLADMGAEVIKIEDPNSPDPTRNYPPFKNEQSVYYLALNHSKKSLSLNLYEEEDKKIFQALVKTADVVVESFRPGTMKKIGIDYESMKQINPKIVYVSVTGYGQTGDYTQKAGHDLNYIAYSGLLEQTGTADSKPIIPAAQIADIMGGSCMTMSAVLLALRKRDQTGQGEHIDISMAEAVLSAMTLTFAEVWNAGQTTERGGGMLNGQLPNYNVYACADGKYVALGALEPQFFQAFCEAVGKPEWMQYAIPTKDNNEFLTKELASLFLSRSRKEWVLMAEEKDMCLTPVLAPEEVKNDAHFQQRKAFLTLSHPVYGDYTALRFPFSFLETELSEPWAAPLLGEDTEAILREIAF